MKKSRPFCDKVHHNLIANEVLLLSTQYLQNNYFQGTLTKGGRLSTVELLVLTSLVQVIFMLKILFIFFTNQATLVRRSSQLYWAFPFSKAFPLPLGNKIEAGIH